MSVSLTGIASDGVITPLSWDLDVKRSANKHPRARRNLIENDAITNDGQMLRNDDQVCAGFEPD